MCSIKTLKLLSSTLSGKGKFCRINKPCGLQFVVTLILIGAGEVHYIVCSFSVASRCSYLTQSINGFQGKIIYWIYHRKIVNNSIRSLSSKVPALLGKCWPPTELNPFYWVIFQLSPLPSRIFNCLAMAVQKAETCSQ